MAIGTNQKVRIALGYGTEANILAKTDPQAGELAFSTDTHRLFMYDGINWRYLNVTYTSAAPDMGYADHSESGYYDDLVTNKKLANVWLGGSSLTVNGGLRIDVENDPDTLEIYLRDAWQTLIYDLTTEYGDFRHTPLSEQIYIWTGHSVTNDLAGQPLVQEYKVSMGAYAVPRLADAGDF